jgi:hypothetical protein
MSWKRIILGLGITVLLLCLVVYFLIASIIEGILASKLEAGGARLDLESVRFSSEGVVATINQFETADFSVRGGLIVSPWSQLWSFRSGLTGQLELNEVRLRMDTTRIELDPDKKVLPAERAASIAAQINRLPLRSLHAVVDAFCVEYVGQEYCLSAELSFLRGDDGDTQLDIDIKASGIDLSLQAQALAGDRGLALDFVGGGSDWETFLQTYLPQVAVRMDERQAELFLSPLAGGSGFLDISGYARWSATEADQLSFTLLADLGASELYFPGGEIYMGAASFGFAYSGFESTRAYAKGAIDSIRYGSWIQSTGEWALRLNGSQLATEVRLGDSIDLSLGYQDWLQALEGAGNGRIYLQANALDMESLRLLPVDGLPDDLDLEMDLRVEGDWQLQDFALVAASLESEVNLLHASSATLDLKVEDLRAEAAIAFSGMQLDLQSLNLELARAQASGFALADVGITLSRLPNGMYASSMLEADFMGGRLQIDPFRVDPANLENLSLRASVESLDLHQLAKAIPQFKGDISGVVSGHLVAAWRNGQVVLTDGLLSKDADIPARLRYDVGGLLTQGLPEESSAYKQYRMAEKAFSDLKLERFRVEVFPEDNLTRPFRMELFGESEQGGLIVPVEFDLNVNVDDTASLLEILRLMRQGQLELD